MVSPDFPKNLFIIILPMLFAIAGCKVQKHNILPRENAGCERLKYYWEALGVPKDKIIFYDKDSNEPTEESSFDAFTAGVLYEAGCCSSMSHPLSKEWVIYPRLECMWGTLQKENIRKITFCVTWRPYEKSPEDWNCEGIIESEKIKEIMKLLGKAMAKSTDRFANEANVESGGTQQWMQIITDKNKFMTPIYYDFEKGATYGIGWTSDELMDKLKQWFPGNRHFEGQK